MFHSSKLLDGIWSHSAESSDSDLCSDSGRALFELFRDNSGDKSGKFPTSSDTNPTGEQHDTKYYTPFGSGISLGDLTCHQLPAKSCWGTEPSEARNGVIGKPLTSTVNRISTSKVHAVTKLSSDIGTKAASGEVEGYGATAFSGPLLLQPISDGNVSKSLIINTQPQNGRQRDAVANPRLLPSTVSNHRPVKSPSPKLIGIPGDGTGKSVSAEQQERQLLATQQLFMHELNRLPPDLRKQYVDYMFATRVGMPPGGCPAVPAVCYNVAVGPHAMPVTQLIGPPVILPAGPIMPTPLITLQPVVPSTVSKSVSR